DRKPERQRLYCVGPIDTTAGVRGSVSAGRQLMLFGRPDASACRTSAVTIVEIGATFGGAGRGSRETTAKMNLDAWQRKPVFMETSSGECRGELTVSFKARHDGEPNPIVSEAGRRFLADQLHR